MLSYGWVVALKDGRRLYLEYTIEVRALLPGETYPVIENEAGVFWYEPDKINEHLGLAGPSLH